MKSRILFRTTIQRLETNRKSDSQKEDRTEKEPDAPGEEQEAEDAEIVISEPSHRDTGRIMFSSLMLS